MAFSWKILLFLIVLVAISNQIIYYVNAQTFPSPLKQLKSGILVQDIKCKEGLVLIIKESNDNPACVKSTTVTRLLSQNWLTLENYVASHPITVNTTKIVTNSTKNMFNFSTTNTINNSTNETSSIQLPHGISTLTISPQKSNFVKILSIGAYPDSLKVGDSPVFNATFQNISDQTFYISEGCRATTLFALITPSDHVVEKPRPLLMCADWQKAIEPNETFTTFSHSKSLNGYYQIIQSGTLNVTLEQVITDRKTGWNVVETIQFNVNATQ